MIATESHHHPYTSLVSFVPSSDDTHLYFPTKKETQKFFNISKNPHIAALIDNRENTPGDFSKATTVIALGVASAVETNKEHIRELLLQKHPDLSDFISHPDCALIDITITTYQIVQQFEKVKILRLRDVPE
ncbi:MAG: pyridoxamine 5'-phosphate oxidase family protein [Candidatus Thermoplasmatota archaeon]|nr:pyridoxamine 5'-phosphate oxidase family protein [Candidatus Thermoplasmatota archaeon]